MGDEPFNRQQTTSSQTSAHSTSPRHLEYATQRAKLLFGSYRRGDANDPDVYVAAVAKVLAGYDASLIRDVTDPEIGISTTEKFASFMPNAGELKRYCEDVAARRARLDRLGSLEVLPRATLFLPPPEPRPGDLANVFVASTNPRYAKLVEWSKRPDTSERLFRHDKGGIWVGFNVWDDRRTVLQQRAQPAEPRPMKLSAATRQAMGLPPAPIADEEGDAQTVSGESAA